MGKITIKIGKNNGGQIIGNQVIIGDQIVSSKGKLRIDGKSVYETNSSETLHLVVEGNVKIVDSDSNVTVNGNVGKIDCGGSVQATNINGDVDCGGSVQANTITGNVECVGSYTFLNVIA